MVRQYEAKDYKLLSKWWKEHGWSEPAPEAALSPRGFISDESAAAFLYLSEKPCKFAYVEWVVSDPGAEKERRGRALNHLIMRLEDEAKKFGYSFILFPVNAIGLGERLERHEYTKAEKVTHYFKCVGG